MVTSQRPKASDKQAVLKKLLAVLKKQYKGTPPASNRNVLETMLYAVCLEDASHEEAEAVCQRVIGAFHDLNEIRVSSISELAVHFEPQDLPEHKAARFRSILQYVFERTYDFDFEPIKKKTVELAAKQLKKIPEITPFVRYYTLQEALGNHFVPLDESMAAACKWLGLLEPTDTPETGAESLKSAVRKSETAQVCYLLRQLAVDPKHRKTIAADLKAASPEGFDLSTAPARLQDLLSGKGAPKKTAARKTAKSSSTSTRGASPARKKTAPKKTASKPASRNGASGKTKKKTKSGA